MPERLTDPRYWKQTTQDIEGAFAAPPKPQGTPGAFIENVQRPADQFANQIGEQISPTLGAFGMGQLAGDTALRASEGDWGGAAVNAPLLAMSFAPGAPKGRFLHGTLKEHLPSIRQNYLEPKAGAFVDHAYGGEYRSAGADLPELVYMAAENDPKRAANAIKAQVAQKLGKSYHDVSPDDIREHGALVVARPNPRDIFEMHEDQTSTSGHGEKVQHYDDASTAEPGDWYSFDAVEPSGFMTGGRLLRYLDRRGTIKLKTP
jgi:hypothetical protein